MAVLYVSQETFEVVLVLCGAFMLLPLKGCVFDVSAAMLAPIFGLCETLVGNDNDMFVEKGIDLLLTSSIRTLCIKWAKR